MWGGLDVNATSSPEPEKDIKQVPKTVRIRHGS